MDTIEAIHTRRSIRAYTSAPVTREQIEAVIWDAAQAPPPFSGQVPWTFRVITGAARIAALGARAKQYAAQRHEGDPAGSWARRADFDIFWGAPVVVFICGGIEDACRAGQTLLLSAHARGLGACWVGSPLAWLADAAVRAELNLPPDRPAAAVICLGYAAATPSPPPRARPAIPWDEGS